MTSPTRDESCSLTFFFALVVVAAVAHGVSWVYSWGWFGAWIGQASLLAMAVHSTPRRAFLGGWLIGCGCLAWGFWWIVDGFVNDAVVTGYAWNCVFALLVAFEALSFAVLAWGASRLARRGLLAFALIPLGWVAIEFWSIRLMPWLTGYTQVECRPLVQIAAIAGPTAIGGLLTFVASSPAAFGVARRHNDKPWGAFLRYAGAVAIVAALWIGGGYWQIAAIESDGRDRPYRVGIAQMRRADEPMQAATEVLSERVDLVIWPQTMLAAFDLRLEHFRDEERTAKLAHTWTASKRPCPGVQCDLIAGGRSFDESAIPGLGPYYITALLIDPDEEILGRYHKRELTPFSEYVPWFADKLLSGTLIAKVPAYARGQSSLPLTTSEGDKIGVVICYEDTVPSAARASVRDGAEILVSILNGANFTRPLPIQQHYRLAFLRAVENRRWFARVSTTGKSALISPTGKVVTDLPIGATMMTPAPAALRDGLSFYTRYGDWFPWVATVVSLFAMAWIWNDRRDSPQPE